MTIHVEYKGQAKAAAGTAREAVELAPDASVARLLEVLGERHGEALRRLLLDAGGAPRPALLLFVGDIQVRDPQSTVLRDGEGLLILSPISGG